MPLWYDLGFFPNSRGNKAAANLRPTILGIHDLPLVIVRTKLLFLITVICFDNFCFERRIHFCAKANTYLIANIIAAVSQDLKNL